MKLMKIGFEEVDHSSAVFFSRVVTLKKIENEKFVHSDARHAQLLISEFGLRKL